MDKAFKNMTFEERLDHAWEQTHHWRGVLRQLNRESIAVTTEEREVLRARVIEAVETASISMDTPATDK